MYCDKCINILSDVLSIKMNERLGRVCFNGVFLVELVDDLTFKHKIVVLDNDYNYCCLCGTPISTPHEINIIKTANIHQTNDQEIFDLLDSADNEEEYNRVIDSYVTKEDEEFIKPHDTVNPDEEDDGSTFTFDESCVLDYGNEIGIRKACLEEPSSTDKE